MSITEVKKKECSSCKGKLEMIDGEANTLKILVKATILKTELPLKAVIEFEPYKCEKCGLLHFYEKEIETA